MSTSKSWYMHSANPVNPVTAKMTFWSEIWVNKVLSISDKAKNSETGADAPSVIIKITCPTLVFFLFAALTAKFMIGNPIPAINTKAGNWAGSKNVAPTGAYSTFDGSKTTLSGDLSAPVSPKIDTAAIAPPIGHSNDTVGNANAAAADAIDAPAAAPPMPMNFGSDSILIP
jgi:hypothetical protein